MHSNLDYRRLVRRNRIHGLPLSPQANSNAAFNCDGLLRQVAVAMLRRPQSRRNVDSSALVSQHGQERTAVDVATGPVDS